MKFPTLSRTKPTVSLSIENDTLASTDVLSSQHTSTSQIEKEKTFSRASSRQNSQHEKEKGVETAPLAEAEALDNLSDEPEYPSGLKLVIIMTSLALSVFLMALVSPNV